MSQPRKIIYKDDFSDNSLSASEEEDDDSDFGAPKKSPKKKPTPKKSKKVVSKKKTPVKVCLPWSVGFMSFQLKYPKSVTVLHRNQHPKRKF